MSYSQTEYKSDCPPALKESIKMVWRFIELIYTGTVHDEFEIIDSGGQVVSTHRMNDTEYLCMYDNQK